MLHVLCFAIFYLRFLHFANNFVDFLLGVPERCLQLPQLRLGVADLALQLRPVLLHLQARAIGIEVTARERTLARNLQQSIN